MASIPLFPIKSIILASEDGQPEVLKHVHNMACTGQWITQIQLLEQISEQPDDALAYSKLHFSAKQILNYYIGTERKLTVPNLAALLLEQPRFSTISAEEIKTFWAIRPRLPEADKLLLVD